MYLLKSTVTAYSVLFVFAFPFLYSIHETLMKSFTSSRKFHNNACIWENLWYFFVISLERKGNAGNATLTSRVGFPLKTFYNHFVHSRLTFPRFSLFDLEGDTRKSSYMMSEEDHDYYKVKL